MNSIYIRTVSFLASKYFLIFIILLFLVQAIWIAISFQRLPYDEIFHYPVIQLFAQQLTPFISNQPYSYDHLGNLSNGGATFYHYLMSFFYRFLEFFGASYETKVITLRLINILFASLGIVLFNFLFNRVGFKKIFINITLFFYVLIPIVPFTAAHINYDNLLLPLTALFFLFCVNILMKKKVDWKDCAGFVITGCLASLVKSAFLPLFAAGVIYLAIFTYKKGLRKAMEDLASSIKKTNKIGFGTCIIVAVALLGMFSYAYIKNVVLYKTPIPSCQATMSKERCLKSSLVERDLNAVETKNTRPKQAPPALLSEWAIGLNQQNGANALSGEVKAAPRILLTATYIMAFVGVGIILYAWRSLKKNSAWYFLLTMAIVLTLSLFFLNVSGYYKTHMMLANQPRYLLSILPIFMILAVVSINLILRRRRWLKLVTIFIALLVCTQGGGIVTYILHGSEATYWKDNKIIEANSYLKKVFSPIVRGE